MFKIQIQLHFHYDFWESPDTIILKNRALLHFQYDFWESPDTVILKNRAQLHFHYDFWESPDTIILKHRAQLHYHYDFWESPDPIILYVICAQYKYLYISSGSESRRSRVHLVLYYIYSTFFTKLAKLSSPNGHFSPICTLFTIFTTICTLFTTCDSKIEKR